MFGKSNFLSSMYGVLLLLAASLFIMSSDVRGAESQPVTIRFGHVQSTTTFPLSLGVQRGIFKRRGLTVIAKPYADFGPLYIGHRSGEIDMGSGGMASIVELHARGVPVKVVWGSSRMNNDILVRADSQIKDPGQLKGRRIGVLGGPSSTSANMLMGVLQAYYGFDPRKDGTVQYGASALLASLLQRGEVEAFMSNDPITAIELAKGRVKSIGEIGKIHASHGGHHPTVGGISVSDQLAAAHPDAVSAFLVAWMEAVTILKKDRNAWEELASKVLGMKDDKVVAMLWERLPQLWPDKWDENDVKGEVQAMEFIARYAGTGFLEKIPASAFTTRFAPK
jgi:NitT/TauT family transport system substrate-binding protein